MNLLLPSKKKLWHMDVLKEIRKGKEKNCLLYITFSNNQLKARTVHKL
jgi:hypothetical protein